MYGSLSNVRFFIIKVKVFSETSGPRWRMPRSLLDSGHNHRNYLATKIVAGDEGSPSFVATYCSYV
jgi:hypothetical protein